MIENKKILAIIPARGGSKGIPRKNVKAISGKPMIQYTIEAAKECPYIDKVVVSTEDEEIADISMRAGAIVPFSRPEELATDEAKTIDVVMHAVEFYERKAEHFDIIVLLQPTSPLRNAEDITKALEYFMRNEQRSLVTVSEVSESPILMRNFNKENKLEKILEEDSDVRRQDMKKFYRINGAIYINKASELNANTSFNDNEMGFVLTQEHGIDVDEPQDLVVAEYYLSQACDGEFLSFIVY
ncbi:MAG: acylneuraminate cytidylyltransferase family protein [Clostridiales bacterium]|nr:acylneuraminate cytidylyltransferase family protein [Clostridiales bacterium]